MDWSGPEFLGNEDDYIFSSIPIIRYKKSVNTTGDQQKDTD